MNNNNKKKKRSDNDFSQSSEYIFISISVSWHGNKNHVVQLTQSRNKNLIDKIVYHLEANLSSFICFSIDNWFILMNLNEKKKQQQNAFG